MANKTNINDHDCHRLTLKIPLELWQRLWAYFPENAQIKTILNLALNMYMDILESEAPAPDQEPTKVGFALKIPCQK